jgi:hypothetical protein
MKTKFVKRNVSCIEELLVFATVIGVLYFIYYQLCIASSCDASDYRYDNGRLVEVKP